MRGTETADQIGCLVNPFPLQDTLLQCWVTFQQQRSLHRCPPYEFMYNIPCIKKELPVLLLFKPFLLQECVSIIFSFLIILLCPVYTVFYLLIPDVLLTFTNYVTVWKNSLINDAHMIYFYYSNIFTNNQFSACLILSLSIPSSKLVIETEANIEPKMDSFRCLKMQKGALWSFLKN